MQRFEEIKCIGRGSYGSAHLVRVRQPNCVPDRFVVKKIPMELLSTKEKDQSFREVELLAKLKHPNVVEYNESFEVDNVLHIVMAYCDGGDLADKIKEQQKVRAQQIGPDTDATDPRGYFPLCQVLDWFVQMAMAIKYLHEQRVLHRDLKTSNVFLTTENVVKLGDFGIAKTLDSTLDQAQTVVGTPYYMSPEVCESKPYSYASDVWSLGCVLYEMLALRHAFDAPNILTLILKIVQHDFAPVPLHYDAEVSRLLRRLLDKNPEQRPSMDEIFAIPYIRHHMQGLVASGGSLKVKVVSPVARRPHHDVASMVNRRRLHPKHSGARRAFGEKRKLRLVAPFTSSQEARVAPLQRLPIECSDEHVDDRDISDELKILDLSTIDASQVSFRLPERSSTPEPLIIALEEKPVLHNKKAPDDQRSSAIFKSVARPQLKRVAQDKCVVAWRQGASASNAQDHCSALLSLSNEHANDDDSRFHAEAEELMNPNYQNEYSEECQDSLQIYYGPKGIKDGSTIRSPDYLRGGGARLLGSTIDSHGTALQLVGLRARTDVPNASALQLDETTSDDNDGAQPSLSESLMMRELEFDADSDDNDASADSSLSEYEAEENFYSDDSSDYFNLSGTQYSDDFEDPDAEVIEYADNEFVSEEEEQDTKVGDEEIAINDISTLAPSALGDACSRVTPMGTLESPPEVQWVMQNVARSLLLTKDELHLRESTSA